jgi:DNA-directed RNA polymerase II subunit RPB2
MLAHGMSLFLKERYMETSDIFWVKICGKCGLIASKMRKKEAYECQACNNSTDISKVVIPYSFKLLIQELMSMSIAPRIRTEKIDTLMSRKPMAVPR